MPRTVAAEYWPLVLKRPLPSPHSLRVLGFLAAADAEDFLAFGQPVSFSVSVSVGQPAGLGDLEQAVVEAGDLALGGR